MFLLKLVHYEWMNFLATTGSSSDHVCKQIPNKPNFSL